RPARTAPATLPGWSGKSASCACRGRTSGWPTAAPWRATWPRPADHRAADRRGSPARRCLGRSATAQRPRLVGPTGDLRGQLADGPFVGARDGQLLDADGDGDLPLTPAECELQGPVACLGVHAAAQPGAVEPVAEVVDRGRAGGQALLERRHQRRPARASGMRTTPTGSRPRTPGAR